MNREDQAKVVKLLQQAFAVYGKPLDADAIDIWLAVLSGYGVQQISYGIQRHLRDPAEGRFAPKPANIIGAIEGAKRELWLSGNEAWANAQGAEDEGLTMVWTREASQAWFKAAKPLVDAGNKIAARSAFLDAYEREISQAIAEGRPPEVITSLGHDADSRAQAIEQARDRGLLTSEQAERELIGTDREVTGDGKAAAALLGHGGDLSDVSDQAMSWIQRIKEAISSAPDPGEERRKERVAESQRIQARRDEALRELRGEGQA